jgi:hypothetical protein
MKLYEIDKAIYDCVDWETGEIIDPAKLEALNMEREKKIEGVALYVKNLEAEAVAIKAEKDAFAEREKQTKKKIESLKDWLSYALNGEKFETPKVKISFRKSEAVEIVDQSALPANFIYYKTEEAVDKASLKIALKNNIQIPGAALIKRNNIQIK